MPATTTVSAGVLQLGNGGTTGSISGNIADAGSVIFNRSNDLTYGSVDQRSRKRRHSSGTGTLTLTGTNTYTGGTTISAGVLQLGNGGTTGSVSGNIVDNGALVFNRSDRADLCRGGERQRLAHPGRHRHADPNWSQYLHRRHDDQCGQHPVARRRWNNGQRGRQHRRQRCADVQPLECGDLWRHDQRHRQPHQNRRLNSHSDRRQLLHRRHDDRRRLADHRQWRHSRVASSATSSTMAG